MGHARLSPSNRRWPECPGSIREEARYEDITNEAAIDGTGSHLLLEMCIGNVNANHMLDQTIGIGHPDKPGGWWVKQDRIDRVNVALRYINMRRNELSPVVVESESESNPGKFFGRDDWHGTADVTIMGGKVLEVIDFKDGRGYVSEKNNSQMIGYAGGKIMEFIMSATPQQPVKRIPNLTHCGFNKVRVTIIQPKTGNPIRYEEYTIPQIHQKLMDLAVAAKQTDDPNAPLIPGKHCEWCKHGRSGGCDAKNRQGMEGITAMAEIVPAHGQTDLIDAIKSGQISLVDMPGDRLAALLDAMAPAKKIIEMADAEAKRRIAENPESIPGYVPAEGKGKYEWIDDEEVVAKKLRAMRLKKDEVLIPTLITPAAARKCESLSDRQLANLEKMIKKVPGKPTYKKSAEPPKSDMFMGVNAGEPAPAEEPAPATAPAAAPSADMFL
jgi:hypothetical protein